MDTSELTLGTPYEVRWVDIISEIEWKKLEDLDDAPVIKTLGYFVGKRVCHLLDCAIFAGTVGMEDEISNTTIIPIGNIISLENLNE